LETTLPARVAKGQGRRYKWMLKQMRKDSWLYLMILPGLLYFIIFKYGPMWGLLMAFQNYQPTRGIWGSDWVGLQHFATLFGDDSFWMLFRNTFLLAVYNLVFFFPLPIVLALLLNEVRSDLYKRSIQTLVYIPHFLS